MIELNSLANVDSLRGRKFVCSLKVVDSSSWCTTGGVVLVLMIRVSVRIVDVPCEINSHRWDQSVFGTTNCNVVFGDTMPYDSCILTSFLWILV